MHALKLSLFLLPDQLLLNLRSPAWGSHFQRTPYLARICRSTVGYKLGQAIRRLTRQRTPPVPNPYTYVGGSQSVSGVAPATPAVPVAPVASPVAPPGASNITPYSLQVPSQDSATVTNPVFRSSLGNQDSQRTGLQQSNLSNNPRFPGSSLNGGLGAER